MDLDKVIRQLLIEREILDIAIAELESLEDQNSLSGARAVLRNPGRTLVRPAERRQLSARAKQYWAGRRHCDLAFD